MALALHAVVQCDVTGQSPRASRSATLPLIFGQPWLLLVALLPIATIVGRVRPEEGLLREVYGGEYEVYATRTRARLIPGFW